PAATPPRGGPEGARLATRPEGPVTDSRLGRYTGRASNHVRRLRRFTPPRYLRPRWSRAPLPPRRPRPARRQPSHERFARPARAAPRNLLRHRAEPLRHRGGARPRRALRLD